MLRDRVPGASSWPCTAQADTGGRGPHGPGRPSRGVWVLAPGHSGLGRPPGPAFCAEPSGCNVPLQPPHTAPCPRSPLSQSALCPLGPLPGQSPSSAGPIVDASQCTRPSPLCTPSRSRKPLPVPVAARPSGAEQEGPSLLPTLPCPRAEGWCRPGLLEPTEPCCRGAHRAPPARTPLCLPARAAPQSSALPGMESPGFYTVDCAVTLSQ